MPRVKAREWVALGLLTCSMMAGADEWLDDRDAELREGPTLTESWLQIQREGSQASNRPQQLTPQERELVNQRWLENFSHPIPEFFDVDAAGTFSNDDD